MQLGQINPFVRLATTATDNFREALCAPYDSRVIYVLRGRGELYINDSTVLNEKDLKAFRLKENSLVYIPAGFVYRIARDENAGLSVAVINFDFTCDNAEKKQIMYPNDVENYNIKNAHFVPDMQPEIFSKPFVMESMQALAVNIKEILNDFEKRYNYYEETMSAVMKTILCRIAANPFSDSKSDATFLRFMEYIEENYGENIENTAVASALCYHPNYLNSVVKNKTGKSMHKYIMEYRIMQAARLLVSHRLSVSEVAARTGFKNTDHFSVYFKKNMGISPSEYAKVYV